MWVVIGRTTVAVFWKAGNASFLTLVLVTWALAYLNLADMCCAVLYISDLKKNASPKKCNRKKNM